MTHPGRPDSVPVSMAEAFQMRDKIRDGAEVSADDVRAVAEALHPGRPDRPEGPPPTITREDVRIYCEHGNRADACLSCASRRTPRFLVVEGQNDIVRDGRRTYRIPAGMYATGEAAFEAGEDIGPDPYPATLLDVDRQYREFREERVDVPCAVECNGFHAADCVPEPPPAAEKAARDYWSIVLHLARDGGEYQSRAADARAQIRATLSPRDAAAFDYILSGKDDARRVRRLQESIDRLGAIDFNFTARPLTPADQALETLALMAEHRLSVYPWNEREWMASWTPPPRAFDRPDLPSGRGATIGDAVRACVERIVKEKA